MCGFDWVSSSSLMAATELLTFTVCPDVWYGISDESIVNDGASSLIN